MAGDGLRPDRHAGRATGCTGSTPRSERRHPTATRQLGREHLSCPRRAGLGGRKPLAHASVCCRASPTLSLGEELAVSRDILRSIVGTCDSISYPWGEVDARVVEASRRAGYAAGSGLSGRFTWSDPMRAPRVAVSSVDDSVRFALKVSGAHWHLRATGAWPAVEALRGMSGEARRGTRPVAAACRGAPQPLQPPLGPARSRRPSRTPTGRAAAAPRGPRTGGPRGARA